VRAILMSLGDWGGKLGWQSWLSPLEWAHRAHHIAALLKAF
jgi:hypothetical protein